MQIAMTLLEHLIAELRDHGTVTVDWKPFAALHFPGRDGMARARQWALERGFVLMFVQSGAQAQTKGTHKAVFYRSVSRSIDEV